MSAEPIPTPEDLAGEIAALVETLQATEKRLAELTGGEVDTVSDREGRTVVLRHAQEQLRHRESERQTAILNALPANIALLDVEGNIISLNERWRQFARDNGMRDPVFGLASNYLKLCDLAKGEDSTEAAAVAAGIRSVLSGEQQNYCLEYPCHSPEKMRWFQLSVSPLSDDVRNGVVIMHSNITDRWQAETELGDLARETSRKERMLHTTLSSIRDFAYILDREGRFVFVNQPLLDLWGKTLEEALGKTFLELGYSEELAAKLTRELEEVFTTRRNVRGETPFTSAAGLEGQYEYIFAPVFAADGSVESVAGSTRDVTERKRVAETLRRSEQEQRQLAAQLQIERSQLVTAQRMAKVGSWETDLTSMSVTWSEESHRIFGTDPASYNPTHHGFLSFVHPDDRDVVSEAFDRSLNARSGSSIEHRTLLPDGGFKFVEERWKIFTNAEGAPVRVSGTCQDITERKQSENALLQSRQRLRDIIDGLGPSMFVALLTPDGYLVEINRPPLEAAGLKPGDVLGQPFAETPWWNHSPAAQTQLREAIARGARGESSRYDARIRGLAENIIDIDFSLQPLRDQSGGVVFLIQSSSVITDRKRAEAGLRQAQKMEAVGQLAAGVAHEFNNLLQTLMSMAAITRLRGVTAEIVKIGTDMEVQIRRGAAVTQQLLLSSRHQEPEKTNLDLREQVRSASDLLRRLLPENISFNVETSSERASVEADAGQLQQVLLNLAINARDAMPDGGTLSLRVARRDSEVILEVEDDGTGFDEATRERLFEPFFTTKEIGKGTGLGLAVVYGIIDQHGGRIEVESAPGNGSCFRVILPAADFQPRPAFEAAGNKAGTGTGRVLLVEDDEGVREGIVVLLEMIGYEVIAAGSAEDAIALELDGVPDVLLTDVSLPGIGGPALATRLRERWPALKITLMTGYADQATRTRARDQGWEILQKPFEMEALTRHLSLHHSAEPEIVRR